MSEKSDLTTHPIFSTIRSKHVWKLAHRKHILALFLIVSTISSGVYMNFFGFSLISSGVNATDLPQYEIDDIVYAPGYNGEMWVENNELHFFGWLIITDTFGFFDRIILSDQVLDFDENNQVAIYSSSYPGGSNTIEFASGSIVGSIISVFVEQSGVWIALWRSLAYSLFGLSIAFGVWLLIPYFGLIEPLRKAKLEARFHFESMELSAKLPGDRQADLLEITNEVRQSLQRRKELIHDRMMRLMNVVTILIFGVIALLAYIVSLPFDPVLEFGIGAMLLVIVLSLLDSANKLLSPIEYEPHPRTLWSYHGNITKDVEDIDTFQADLVRFEARITFYEHEHLYRENLKEIMRLYYILSITESKYNEALSGIKLPVYLGAVIVLVWLTTFLGIVVMIILGLSILLCILFLLVVIISIFLWYKEDFTLTRYILFYSPKGTDISLPCNDGYEQIEGLMSAKGVLPYLTDAYTEGQFDEIMFQVKNVITEANSEPDEARIYGEEEGMFNYCGKEVPILFVVRAGERQGLDVYPRIESDGVVVTKIVDFLNAL